MDRPLDGFDFPFRLRLVDVLRPAEAAEKQSGRRLAFVLVPGSPPRKVRPTPVVRAARLVSVLGPLGPRRPQSVSLDVTEHLVVVVRLTEKDCNRPDRAPRRPLVAMMWPALDARVGKPLEETRQVVVTHGSEPKVLALGIPQQPQIGMRTSRKVSPTTPRNAPTVGL